MSNSLNYYDATANSIVKYPFLDTQIRTDVCVVGAGFTGLGVALELAQKGMSVVVLEAAKVGFGASGRNGGQIASGYAPGMIDTAAIVGQQDAAKLWEISELAKQILYGRIKTHDIECDLRFGELYAAPKSSHLKWLREEKVFCEEHFGYQQYRWIDKDEMRNLLAGDRYIGALLDLEGGHLHPLNYVLGLAKAAENAGALIFENSAALKIETDGKVSAYTAKGCVKAEKLVLAGNAYLTEFGIGNTNRIMPVKSSILATEPLGEDRARAIMATDACVADTYFDLDYFKMTPDNRLVYGGQDSSFGGSDPQDNDILRNMLKTFPMLSDVKVDYMWDGKLAVTRHRLPDLGRVGKNIYYAHGYSGQGVPLSAAASQILADAICGEMGRLDVFGRIPHKRLPANKMVQAPLLYFTLLWHRIRDLL